MNNLKFNLSAESDFDCQVLERVFVGKCTPQRKAILNKVANQYNKDNESPYGISPNGHSYTCGCIHDCCGCLIRSFASVEQTNNGYTLKIHNSYNF